MEYCLIDKIKNHYFARMILWNTCFSLDFSIKLIYINDIFFYLYVHSHISFYVLLLSIIIFYDFFSF